MTRDRTEWSLQKSLLLQNDTRDAVGSHMRQLHREHDKEAVCVNVCTFWSGGVYKKGVKLRPAFIRRVQLCVKRL